MMEIIEYAIMGFAVGVIFVVVITSFLFCSLSSTREKQMKKIIKMCKSEPNMEIKFPVIMQDLNETDDEYRKRIRKYMEQ